VETKLSWYWYSAVIIYHYRIIIVIHCTAYMLWRCLSGASCRLSVASVKSRLVFTFLVPAHLGSRGKRGVKWVCVIHCIYVCYCSYRVDSKWQLFCCALCRVERLCWLVTPHGQRWVSSSSLLILFIILGLVLVLKNFVDQSAKINFD